RGVVPAAPRARRRARVQQIEAREARVAERERPRLAVAADEADRRQDEVEGRNERAPPAREAGAARERAARAAALSRLLGARALGPRARRFEPDALPEA